MRKNFVYPYLTLIILCRIKLNFVVNAETVETAEHANEHRINLMHEMLARILANADAAKNFLIAPQEALQLYRQLHGSEEEIAATEAASITESSGESVVDSNTAKSDDAVRNEVKSDNEYEEFYHIGGNPILVSNTLYANVYTAKRFTRKLKNLQFVLYAESDEEEEENDKSTSSSRNIDKNKQKHSSNSNGQPNNDNKNRNRHNELINTVRINSRWAHNFQKRDTHKRQFHMPQIHATAYLNAMRKDDIFPYANLEELNASALELSLQRWQLKMLIILPHAQNGLGQLLQRLSANVTLLDELCGMKLEIEGQTGTVGAAGVGGVNQRHRHLESTLVRVSLPQFRVEQRTVLDDVFQQLLNITANVDLHWPSAWQVIQEAHFAVNEDGIGELQPSMVLFWNAFSSLRTKPLIFSVDHPFLFIVHNRQGIQLLGHLAQLHE